MNFKFIQLHALSKEPIFRDWKNKYQTVRPNGNYGVLAGKINNIIIVDIDIKDNGLKKWEELTEEHELPDTYTVKTGTGGFHYYFNYNEVIKNKIKLKIDGLSYGIDILTDGKFAVGYGSIHPVTRKQYTLYDSSPIADMPEWLLGLIVASYTISKPVVINEISPSNEIVSNKIFGELDDEEFEEALYSLDESYLNNYDDWLKITTVCKFHDMKDSWDKWSKSSKNYNSANNNKIWNSIKNALDVNFIMSILERPRMPYTYDYTPLTDIQNIKRSEQNNRYLNIEGMNDNTMIIKSDTGTGKTTSTCKLLKDEEYILSIVSRCSLVQQHIISFAKVGVDMKPYTMDDVYKEKIVCCQIDSIIKINISNVEKMVVYLDEINSTLNYLLNSSTLMNRRDKVFKTFSYIIKNCKRVIASDADISDLVFKYITNYRRLDECVFVDNIYKNYNMIKAIHMNDVTKMIETMKKLVSSGKGFVATFDHLKDLNRIYEMLYHDSVKNMFIKITSEDDDFKNTDWDGKCVFYTPKIVYGIDYVPVNSSVDVFVFCKGGTIDPLQIAQQATRCRKIKTLYFNVDANLRIPKYNSYDGCEKYILNNLNLFVDKLEGIYLNDDLEYTARECIFNKLYIYSSYVNDIITSNYRYHFNEILKKKGFNLSSKGEHKKIAKEKMIELDTITKDKRKTLIQRIIDGEHFEDREQFMKAIRTRIHELLKLSDDTNYMNDPDYETNFKKILVKYQEYIFDNTKLQSHFKICKMLFNDDLIFNNFSGMNRKDFNIKQLDTTEAKIFLIVKIENILNINKYKIHDISFEKLCDEVNYSAEDHKLILRVFKKKIKYSNNYYDVYKILGKCLLSLAPSIYDQEEVDIDRGGKRINALYNLNKEKIMTELELYKYRDSEYNKINKDVLSMLGIEQIEYIWLDD